jgi:phosphonate transport system substrate-binding protein
MNRLTGFRQLTAGAACILAVAIVIIGPAPHAAAQDFHLSIGYISNAYPGMTSKDIKAAISVLMKKIALEYFGKSEARHYDSIAEMASDLRNGTIQAACLPPEEYMDLRSRVPIEPILTTASDNGQESELLLIVRRDSGIRSLEDLKNRSLIMPQRNPKVDSMFQVWIETMLLRKGQPKFKSFFSVVKEAPTSAKVIMSTFFHQSDACLVTRQGLELTAELNPQISRELIPLARIQNLAQGIISVDVKVPREIKEKIRQAFISLNKTPEGKQLMTLFHISTFTPFRPEHLMATEALFAEHKRLRNKYARR